MKVDEFVSSVIYDIMKGVVDAQKRMKELESTKKDEGKFGVINPVTKTLGTRDMVNTYGEVMVPGKPTIENVDKKEIEMCIAITVSEQSGIEGGAKIAVLAFNAGTTGSQSQTNSTVSTVKFSIPVLFPRWPYNSE